jgi:hypothetical protein
MGGPGSGRWRRHIKRISVDDLPFILDINRWTQEGIIKAGNFLSGRWIWEDPKTGEEKSAIRFDVDCRDPFSPSLRLHYTITQKRTGEQVDVDYKIYLQTTCPHFGGKRWWFTCPGTVNGHPCSRRVGKLYAPPGARYFGCRHCHHLTYDTCLLSHNSDFVALGVPPGRLLRAIRMVRETNSGRKRPKSRQGRTRYWNGMP